ncbi:MAG: TraR/DksA family transcriptional regulator [Bryobacterales bacterium]|nr:TraR/DksA family transcriptional regulator [Bryobacterales bacterium]
MIDTKQSLAALMNRRAELTGTVVNLEEIHIERVADELDLLQQSSERELAIARIHRDNETIRKIDAALQRLREGSYGVCEDCEQAIAPARLKAIPWAARCVRCQERADSRTQFETLREAA